MKGPFPRFLKFREVPLTLTALLLCWCADQLVPVFVSILQEQMAAASQREFRLQRKMSENSRSTNEIKYIGADVLGVGGTELWSSITYLQTQANLTQSTLYNISLIYSLSYI